MQKLILGIFLAALAGFFWGFLYWGLNPLPYSSWKSAQDDVAAGKALLAHFPERGTYYVPSREHDAEELTGLMEGGPVAFVHMLRPSGRPLFDPAILESPSSFLRFHGPVHHDDNRRPFPWTIAREGRVMFALRNDMPRFAS